MANNPHTTNTHQFTTSNANIQALLEYLHPITDLSALAELASWDQQTYMPRGAGEMRMHQSAVLQSLIHERIIDSRLSKILDQLEAELPSGQFTDADRGLLRDTRRTYDRARKLPSALVEELSRVASASVEAWLNAREKNDFAIFAPLLQRTITLQREVAERIGYTEVPYDALLDDYEPGLTTRKVEQLFEPVRTISTTLLKRIQQSGHVINTSCLNGQFPTGQQEALCKRLLGAIHYDFSRGQLTRSEHPFTISFGAPFDVRVTTRYQEDYLPMALMAAIHEGGHALYEQGITPGLARTPLARGTSMGIHESQSRLWENAIGRSYAFWKGQEGLLHEAFPEHFAHVELDTFVRAINHVQPSLIRVEADEVTYNLHILIRFELEKALVNGEISLESLPGEWNKRYQEYLGIEPINEVDGVLQDIHWTSGFGYFPTYTLGNLYAAQLFYTLNATFKDFDERLSVGNTRFILDWLHDYLHQYGAIYQPEELIKRATSQTPDPQYFVRYLTEKFEKVYDLPQA